MVSSVDIARITGDRSDLNRLLCSRIAASEGVTEPLQDVTEPSKLSGIDAVKDSYVDAQPRQIWNHVLRLVASVRCHACVNPEIAWL
jgi:hypothetical protein